MRSSKQRDLVLSIINSQNKHLTAEEIYNLARQSIPNIGLGTIYRDINQLVETNQINRISLSDGKYRYDSAMIKHHYFICNKCGKVEDVYQNFDLSLEYTQNKVLDYDIYFKGTCSDCNKEV